MYVRPIVAAAVAAAGVDAGARGHVADNRTLLALVAAGHGATIVPEGVLADAPAGLTIADVDLQGPLVRVRGADLPDGGTGLAADVTAAAAVDLALEPGRSVFFAVKAQEVTLHAAPQRPSP